MSVDIRSALDAALWMASHGYQIWPCRIKLKPRQDGATDKDITGLPPKWTYGGLTDFEAIKAQWISVRATAYMIVCGPSKITGVDLDMHDSVNGYTNYINAGGTETANFVVRSWSGGWHFYHQSAGAGTSTGTPMGVDVRGVGGGLFGPGSIVLDAYGNFAGQYTVHSGFPNREGLTPEPPNLSQITSAPRVPDAVFSGQSNSDSFFSQYPPMTRTRARNAIASKVTELRNMKCVANSGMRVKIMGAALLLGGLLHAKLGYDEAEVRKVLLEACDEVFKGAGGHSDDDEKWIDTGLEDGQFKKPIPVYDDPPPPEQADPLNTSGYVAGSDDRIVDLGPYLDGTHIAPEPSVGAKRNGGQQMLYPSRWHTVVGLTEAGKSLFAIWHAIEVMKSGGLVVYLHFEESDVRGTLERLRRFGKAQSLDDDTIRKQFVWMHCETAWAKGAFAQALSRLPSPPALVVLDGVNAAASQHGQEVMHPKSVSVYRSLFVKPATALGATVLSLGHPVKDRQRQGERHSFGSTAWLDEVDGVAFRLVAASNPISKGTKGASALSVVKDRYGSVKQHGKPEPSKEAGWFYLGQFVVDDSPPEGVEPWRPEYTQRGTEAFLTAPGPKKKGAEGLGLGLGAEEGSEGQGGYDAEPDPKALEDNTAVLAQLARFRDLGQVANKRAMYSHIKIAKSRVDNALTRLIYGDRVTEADGPRGSKIYSLPSEQPTKTIQAPWGTVTVPHDQS